TDKLIGFALGLPSLKEVLQAKYYSGLSGGVLEAAGRLFQRSVKVYVYPARIPHTNRIETFDDMAVPAPWDHLHRLLREVGEVEPNPCSKEAGLSIKTPYVLKLIQDGDASWEAMVPEPVAEIIKKKNLFRAAARALPNGSPGH